MPRFKGTHSASYTVYHEWNILAMLPSILECQYETDGNVASLSPIEASNATVQFKLGKHAFDNTVVKQKLHPVFYHASIIYS